MKKHRFLLVLSLAAWLFSGCAADSSSKSSTGGNNGGNVNVGGVQDIGVFRQIIESGGIPGPDMLDANGFFSEHHLDIPAEDCGENLCLFGMLGRGVSLLSDDFMNVLQVGFKTFVNPLDYERPPTDFVAVIDVSGSMYSDAKLEYVRQGLHMMIDTLEPGDRMALVAYSDRAQERLPLTFADSSENRSTMHSIVNGLVAGGSTNIYDALTLGFDIARLSMQEGRYARVVFLSDGQPTAGITDAESIVSLARECATKTSQLTSIGVGYDVNFDLMRELAMAGGNFYFIDESAALVDIFVEEVKSFAFPIAENVHLSVSATDDFILGDSVGFESFVSSASGGEAVFPALYMATRTSSQVEDPNARRGGGSAMFVRFVPTPSSTFSLSGMLLTMTYTDPETGETVGPQRLMVSDMGEDGMLPENEYFSHEPMRKAFAMLNIYLALREVCTKAVQYDFGNASQLLAKTIDYARLLNDVLGGSDDDIAADIELMEKLQRNLGGGYNCGYEGGCMVEDEVVYTGCNASGSSSVSWMWMGAFLLGLFVIRCRR